MIEPLLPLSFVHLHSYPNRQTGETEVTISKLLRKQLILLLQMTILIICITYNKAGDLTKIPRLVTLLI